MTSLLASEGWESVNQPQFCWYFGRLFASSPRKAAFGGFYSAPTGCEQFIYFLSAGLSAPCLVDVDEDSNLSFSPIELLLLL